MRSRHDNILKKLLLRSEGSALVLVMFVALLLTILGLAVLGATIGGAQRSETRENDVQSLHLAQKGLNEAVAYIQSRIDGKEDIDPEQLESIFKDLDAKNLKVKTELGTSTNNASGTINEIKYSNKSFGQQSRKYYIDVTASAVVNGVNRKLKQRITLDSYPDFLKYAFGSEQTLRINGAPVLYGNIYAGEKLIVTNRANYRYKENDFKKKTIFPRVRELEKDKTSGEVHIQSLKSIEYSEYTSDDSGIIIPPQAVDISNRVLLNNILSIPTDKVKIKEKKKFVQINVEESFYDKLAEVFNRNDPRPELRNVYNSKLPKQTALNSWLISEPSIIPIKRPILPIKDPISSDDSQEKIDAIEQEYNDKLDAYHHILETQLKDQSSSLVYDGDLIVDNVGYNEITFTSNGKNGVDGANGSKPQWLVVAGDLTIDNYNKYIFLPIKANILVTGNVIIRGNVEFNSTMIVLGETKIEDAIIHKYENKELVLISKGPVLVNRVDAFSNLTDPDNIEEMNAFFYTDSTGNLYGVGTMFWLNGGFFAKGDLTINAVVGNVSEPIEDASLGLEIQKSQSNQFVERFRIEYNSKIFDDQKASLPRVKTVSVSVGPMELVK